MLLELLLCASSFHPEKSPPPSVKHAGSHNRLCKWQLGMLGKHDYSLSSSFTAHLIPGQTQVWGMQVTADALGSRVQVSILPKKKKSERERTQSSEISNSFIGVLLPPPWPPFHLPCHTLMNFNLYVRFVLHFHPHSPIFINHVVYLFVCLGFFFSILWFILPQSIIHPDSNIRERAKKKENKPSQHFNFLQCFITECAIRNNNWRPLEKTTHTKVRTQHVET